MQDANIFLNVLETLQPTSMTVESKFHSSVTFIN